MNNVCRAPLKIAASIECANQLQLGKVIETLEAAGIDMLHVDMMDGHFVPNLGLGLSLLKYLSGHRQYIDVHLMVYEPQHILPTLADLGVDSATVHIEACHRPFHIIEQIHKLDMQAGLAFNPATSLTPLNELLPHLDRVVLMSVDPGFVGQKFIPSTLRRIREVAQLCRFQERQVDIQVDGGLDWTLLHAVWAAGVTCIIAGTSTVFTPGTNLLEQASLLRALCNNPGALAEQEV